MAQNTPYGMLLDVLEEGVEGNRQENFYDTAEGEEGKGDGHGGRCIDLRQQMQ